MADDKLVDAKSTFSSFAHILDSRLLRALADLAFAHPTLVQTKAIPLALEGRDILARARTGSGKTAAYCIPLVQKILTAKGGIPAGDPKQQVSRGLILVPTRELSEQVTRHLRRLIAYCDKDVTVANVVSGNSTHVQWSLLADMPDIVISTPTRALGLLQSKTLSLEFLETLVIDEADLILSYGHDDDIRQIFSGGFLPKIYQSLLMSATMTKDVETLKGIVLRNPVTLRLEEEEDDAANLTQYFVKCSEVDKFLLIQVMIKMRMIKGKCILFVNDVDRCYRLKLFLEQFSIKSCVLNAELPLNSRYHIVEEFNKGVYDFIIATDESGARGEEDSDGEEEEDSAEKLDEQEQGDEEDPRDEKDFVSAQRDNAAFTSTPLPPSSRKRKWPYVEPDPDNIERSARKLKHRKRKGADKEYGVSRGVDFVDVAVVLNFDLPTSTRAYTHRVGRTARAGRTGMALSFIISKEEFGKNKVVGGVQSTKRDELVWDRIEKEQSGRGSKVMEYRFDAEAVEGFRYRMQDALRSVTRAAVKEARVKEIKVEILNSDKLKAHFEDNPLDLEYLRHDKALHPTRIQPHMKHVPKYLLPKMTPPASSGGMTGVLDTGVEGGTGFVPFKKDIKRGRGRGRGGHGGRGGRGGGAGRGAKKKSDPLKKFG